MFYLNNINGFKIYSKDKCPWIWEGKQYDGKAYFFTKIIKGNEVTIKVVFVKAIPLCIANWLMQLLSE